MDTDNIHLDQNPSESQYKLPLGLCKQAVMKLESAMTDILEIKEDPDISEEDKYVMEGCAEIVGQVTAVVVNMVTQEMDEDSFLAEEIPMDDIDTYPGDDTDILHDEIE